MNFENFVTELLLDLKNNNQHAITLLNENNQIIQENLGSSANPITLDRFIEDLNNVVIQNKQGKYDLIESVLKHNAMDNVYNHFKESNVMIKAIQSENKNALKWLQSMKVSPYVQDANGMNVLMHAIRNKKWDSFIKSFASDATLVNQEDALGRTALFHALHNPTGLWAILECNVDIDHRDHDGNTVLNYCCKNDLGSFQYIINHSPIDVNVPDNDGRTVAMNLAIKGKYTEVNIGGTSAAIYVTTRGKHSLFHSLQKAKCNFNYVNENGESALSLLLKHMYMPKGINSDKFEKYIGTLLSLTYTNCDLDMPVDEDGNTAMMVFLMVNDIDTYNFMKKYNKKLDLTKKNKYGENAFTLFLKYQNGTLNEYVSKTRYADVKLTESMIEKEKVIYKAMEKELGISGKFNRTLEMFMSTYY